ncbi:hypothetical protein P691DRAFT_761748 [Macrolepiota fuliginosa MF-IS2]|uniref:Nitrogen permease regulator 3 n=1 Tax=Macrolepiota fuliginosa MF-IS2 TaxID=1400762 RepID=A0A9P6C242_9AGAR|nr:hypothetical protein P691DRAFT_761748 [Macrolepiota fuliginosa MF-IS2]
MAESLLAILLVTSSAKGPALVYRWPPSPVCSPRLCRARPVDGSWPSQLDNPWRASHTPEALKEQTTNRDEPPFVDDPEHRWQRPIITVRIRSPSVSTGTSPHSPPDRTFSPPPPEPTFSDEYDQLFGYQVDFLAGLLLPHRSMCHQKFELVVDDLAFIGHPVCVDKNGKWTFTLEKSENGTRGRDSKGSPSPLQEESEASSLTELQSEDGWLQFFHLVFVLDLPDPSSSASGNLSKYFDTIYEQVAFTVTAVLFQEQVTNNFVEEECDKLGALRDLSLSEGEPFTGFANKGLQASSIASAMKSLFEAIKTSRIVQLTINDFPLELQLPPHLDALLHNEDEAEMDYLNAPEEEDSSGWGPEMSFGWRLPTLTPWKSLLLLDEPKGGESGDPYLDLKGLLLNPEDRGVAEGLVKFLETVAITLSLADVASLLDWDLEAQVYPIVRWLVYHRRAKIVDTIHPGLKTAFTVPPRFDAPLSDLTAEFAKDFNHPAIPPLPRILSTISSSMSKQTENHFYACFVQSKELIPTFHDVVIWMLKHDLLITLHLRIRIVATPDLKLRVQLQREKILARKKARLRGRGRKGSRSHEDDLDPQGLGLTTFPHPGLPWLSLSPKKPNNRLPSADSSRSGISELVIREDEEEFYVDDDYGDYGNGLIEGSETDMNDVNDSSWEGDSERHSPSIISDPARATPLQRRWLSAMSEGKDPYIAKRFEQINQYFDGSRSDDEILYRAEISRKQLREVLHHYEEYLQTFLHPS